MRYFLAFLLALALPVHAQQLSDEYSIIGQMDAIYDGSETDFFIATRPERGDSFAEIKVFMGREMLQITGVSADENGGYDNPMLSFTIGMNGNNLGMMNSLTVMEAGRDMQHPTEAIGIEGELQITNFSRTDGGTISFDFNASAVRKVLNDEWEQSPEEGMPPLPVSGHVALVIPAEFIAE